MLKHGPSLLLAGIVATAATIMLGGVVPARHAPVQARAQAAVPAAVKTAVTSDDAFALQKALDDVVKSGSMGAVAELRDARRGVWRGTSGVADRVTRARPTTGHRFRIASISKTFMAALVMSLVDDGRVRLTDTVETHLPGLLASGSQVTVRNLLGHTSGVYSYSYVMPSVLEDPLHHYEPEELVALAERHEARFTPGARASYSNTNFVVLAMLVEKLTGDSYADAMAERIFRPLGLSATSVPADADVPSPFMRAYRKVEGADGSSTWADLTEFDPTRWYGTAQLISTVGDVNAFFTALLDGRLVSAARLAEMKTVFADGGYEDYGLGIIRKRLSCGVTVWMHAGNITGYRTWSVHSEGGQRHLTMFQSLYEGPASTPGEAMVETAFCHIPLAAAASPAGRSGVHAWTPESASVFAVNNDDKLSVARRSGTAWKISEYGGTLRSGLAVASGGFGEVRAYAAGPSGTLAEFRGTTTSGGWRVLPYRITSSPAVMTAGPGRYHVYLRGSDGRLKHVSINGTATSQSDLGLAVSGSPVVVPSGPHTADVFVADTAKRVVRLSYSGGRWRRTLVGGRVTSSPAAVTFGDGRFVVFVRGTDNTLWTARNASGSWSWRRAGTAMYGPPAVAPYGDGLVRAITVNAARHPVVHSGSLTATSWSYRTMAGTLAGTPAVYRMAPSDLRLVATTSTSLYSGVVGATSIGWSRLGAL